MMNDEERRKVFWLLQKYSSYTAWNALANAYYEFSDAWMIAIRSANWSSAAEEENDRDWTKTILDGRIAFEKGLPLLKKGDKSVFCYRSNGYLGETADTYELLVKIMNPNEYVLDWMKNKNDVENAYSKYFSSIKGLFGILERSSNVYPAGWGSGWIFKDVYQPFDFPIFLGVAPSPMYITVETGAEVPFDGIYEPEWGAAASAVNGFFNKLKSTLSSPPSLMGSGNSNTGPVERLANVGCMNYLLANTTAPQYQDGERDKPMPVTWRLVWKDERYLDGTIPEEEKEYLAVRDATQSSVNPDAISIRVEARKSCPQTGYYFTPAQTNSRRLFKQGDIMPSLGGDYGMTIWQWDEQQ